MLQILKFCLQAEFIWNVPFWLHAVFGDCHNWCHTKPWVLVHLPPNLVYKIYVSIALFHTPEYSLCAVPFLHNWSKSIKKTIGQSFCRVSVLSTYVSLFPPPWHMLYWPWWQQTLDKRNYKVNVPSMAWKQKASQQNPKSSCTMAYFTNKKELLRWEGVDKGLIVAGETLIMRIFTHRCIWYNNLPDNRTIQSIREAYQGSRIRVPLLWKKKSRDSR